MVVPGCLSLLSQQPLPQWTSSSSMDTTRIYLVSNTSHGQNAVLISRPQIPPSTPTWVSHWHLRLTLTKPNSWPSISLPPHSPRLSVSASTSPVVNIPGRHLSSLLPSHSVHYQIILIYLLLFSPAAYPYPSVWTPCSLLGSPQEPPICNFCLHLAFV